MEDYYRAVQATDDIMAHAHCMLGTQGYKHALSEYQIITAFLLQQCLNSRDSMLRCTCSAWLVKPNLGLSTSHLPNVIWYFY